MKELNAQVVERIVNYQTDSSYVATQMVQGRPDDLFAATMQLAIMDHLWLLSAANRHKG